MTPPKPVAAPHANAVMKIVIKESPPRITPGRGLVTLHEGGHITVEKDGNRVGELEKPWPLLWAEHCAAHGIDPADFDLISPTGKKLRLVQQIDGVTWNVAGS